MSSKNATQTVPNLDENGSQNGNGKVIILNEIKDGMPEWKKALLAKKNEEILAEIEKEKEKEEAEKQKYANLPSWKAEIMRRKDEEKRKKEDIEIQKAIEKEKEEGKFKLKPSWQQELIKRRNSYQNTA